MTRKKYLLLSSLSLITLLCCFGTARYASAQVDPSVSAAKKSACTAIGGTIKGDQCNTPGGPSLQDTISSVVNILSVLVGVAAVIMVIVGGFKYVTSGGDSGAVGSAKNTIVYAVIGIIVVALAQTIMRFVVHTVTTKPAPNKFKPAASLVITRDA